MRAPQRIVVRATAGDYTAMCGRGTLARAGQLAADLGENTGIFILSSPRVWKHCGRKVASSLRRSGGCRTILFDDREASKNMRTVEALCRRLVRAGADRRAVLVAVGGGVVGDVAGFVAASYLRGIHLVHVPTTLVAQVDSATGGKTGVNLPEGKNLVGAFYPPRLVLADPAVLSTLPARQFRSGIYEVIKYGVIGDAALFRFLERRLDDLLSQRATALDWIVPRCIRAKARVVSRDEREAGLREILNFGHTVGHALEAATRYKRFLHGEAVAWGMVAAVWLAVGLQRLAEGEAARIIRLISRVGALPRLPGISASRLLRFMRADKKSRGGRLRFVLPRRIGRVETMSDIPERLIGRVWSHLLASVR
jgi:3-dehydroquinate synthase